MWAIPAFIARAATSTSGTKMMLSRNLTPTMAMPASNPKSKDVVRRVAAVQGLFGKPVYLQVLARDQGVGDLLHELVGLVQGLAYVFAFTRSGDPFEFFLQAVVGYGHGVYSVSTMGSWPPQFRDGPCHANGVSP